MATYELSSQQIVTINEVISFLDAFGTQHSAETVFSEYTFYRRQTTAARQLETLKGLVETLKDLQQQLNNVRTQKDAPEQTAQASSLERRLGYIVISLMAKAQNHRTFATVARVGNFFTGG